VSSTRPAAAVRTVSPREDRAKHLRPDYARASRVARERAGVSQSELAAALGVAKPFIGHSELGGDRPVPTVLHVASAAASPAARAWASEVVRWQATKLALVVLEQTENLHGDDHAARLANVIEECNGLSRELARAHAAGPLTLDQLECIEREARDSAQASLEAQAWASAEIKRRREAG
jgi:transcriptional regulator with XRE-family HTH domain